MFHVVNMIKIDQNKSVIDLDTLLCCHSSIPTAFMVYLANRNQPNINIKSNRQIYICVIRICLFDAMNPTHSHFVAVFLWSNFIVSHSVADEQGSHSHILRDAQYTAAE